MRILYFIIFNLTILSFDSFAEEDFAFHGLYKIEIELESTDRNSVNEGMGRALKQLMVKLSGSSGINVNQEIRKAVNEPEAYINEYRLSSNGEKILGIFSFDGDKLRKLLSDNSLPLWIGIKPKILLFLPCKAQVNLLINDKKYIKQNNELCFKAQNDLTRMANFRNIIFIEPSLDLTDLSYIDVYQPKSIKDYLDKIAERYSLKNWTICYIKDEFGFFMGEPYCLSPVSLQVKTSLSKTVEILANKLFKDFQLTVDPNLRTKVRLLVSGIEQFNDLVFFEDILRSNALIVSYTLSSFQGSLVTFRVEIKGKMVDLKKLMDVNPQLLNQQGSKNSEGLEYFFKGREE